MLIILTGQINAGKSTWLEAWVRAKSGDRRHTMINGWITLPFFENGKKSGHDFCPIVDSKLLEPVTYSRKYEFKNSFQFGCFYLNCDVFDRIVHSIPKNGLFIIDEIGLLEMRDKSGFYPVIKDVLNATKDQFFVIQKTAIDLFMEKYQALNFQVIDFANINETHLL